MNTRIKKLRKDLNLTQQEFANRIGLKQNSIALIESGKRNISDQAILSICREFKVNEEWIRNGIGDVFCANAADTLDLLMSEYSLTQMERIVVEKFLELSHETRQGIIEYALSIASTVNSLQPTTIKSERDQLHAELDRQIDMEKEAKEKSKVYFSTG